MKLSTRSRYGARILLELAKHSDQDFVQVSEIARQQSIPAKYIEQLIRVLKSAHLVSSIRGSRGGYTICKDPAAISLGEIVRLFEEQTELVECISSPEICEMSEECRVRLAWKEATAALYDKLDSVSIANLACEKNS